MADVELRLIANNEQYINAVREAQRASQDLYQNNAREQRREKGLIQDIGDEIRRLEEAKKEAWDVESIEKYNQKIDEAKKDLKEYEEVGRKNVKTTDDQAKSGNKMVSTLKAWALGAVSVTAALKAFRTIMNSTKATADALAATKAYLTARVDVLARSIATLNFTDLGRRMTQAANAAREYSRVMAELGDRKRSLEVLEAGYTAKLAQLRTDMRDTTLTYQEQNAALDEYMEIRAGIAAQTIDIANVELAAVAKTVAAAVDMRGEDLQDFIENYNERLPIMEQAQRLQKAVLKEAGEYRDRMVQEAKDSGRSEAQAGIDANNVIGETMAERISLHKRSNELLKDLTDEELVNYLDMVRKYGEGKDDQYDIVAAAMIAQRQANAMIAQDEQELVRVKNRIAAQRIADEKQEKDDLAAIRAEFLSTIADLEEQAELQRIENLKGLERLIAEEEYNIAQIDKLEAHLESLGDMEEGHYQMLDSMREEVQIRTINAQLEFYEEEKALLAEHDSEVLALNREIQESALELIEDNEKEKLALRIRFLQEDKAFLVKAGDEISLLQAQILDNQIELLKRKLDSMSEESPMEELIGLSPEQINAMRDAARTVSQVMDDIFEARVRDAERRRQLLDTQISETQRALDRETALMRDGFANNVEIKEKELQEMQRLREEALQREEQAIKAQRLLDSVSQTSNLVTSSAEIFKQFSKIPVIGIPLAIAMIGTMFGAFAAAKVKAKESTKLAKGGTGMVTGNRHSQGGEAFGDHIEVESGERWGVLSRGASKKYGKVFEQMVNSFNRGKMPVPTVPVFNMDTEKTVDKLVSIESEMKSMNKHFKGKKVEYSGGVRIERSKNKTRIVKRNV